MLTIRDPYHTHPFSEKALTEAVQQALQLAKAGGAEQAEAGVSEERGYAVTVRQGAVETLEHHQQHSLSLSVYMDQRCASVSTTDFSPEAIQATVQKACQIAQYAGQDPFAGLADPDRLAHSYPDLGLYHPWDLSPSDAIEKAIRCEAVALEFDPRIDHSEGVDVSTYDGFKVYGNTHGFLGYFPSSRHGMSISLIAKDGTHMERDYEYTTSRSPEALDDEVLLARDAAEKTIQRLGARKIKTQVSPVIFHASVARTLIRAFANAISGGNLYRKTSFLYEHLGEKIFPDFIQIYQEPHLRGALGSMPFDAEGVKTEDQHYVVDGKLERYLLGSYSARKLGMQSTGNAGGIFNLGISHTDHSLAALLEEMGTGLLVTDLMGQGVNLTTGDYSRGATGFWIEGGEIQFPVHEVTIAGNLKSMFAGLVAIGNDTDLRGNLRVGSIWLDKMTIAGS